MANGLDIASIVHLANSASENCQVLDGGRYVRDDAKGVVERTVRHTDWRRVSHLYL